MRSLLLPILKLTFAGLLIYWLWSSGKLNLNQLSIVYKEPQFLFLAITTWVVTHMFLGVLRWRLLLRGVGYDISYLWALKLQLTGLFFNTALPGAVGGDLVKAGYLVMGHPGKGKSPAMISILMDRLVGLFGLFIITGMIILFDYSSVISIEALRPLVYMVFGVILAITFGLWVVFKQYPQKDPILHLLEKPYPGSKQITKIYTCFKRYKDHKRYVFMALGFSVLIQGAMLFYFYSIANHLLPAALFTSIALVFPIGMLVTALPLAPGGLGVGHVAFDTLFQLVGYQQGATVFNIFVVSMLCMHLLGVIPYLTLKKKPRPKDNSKKELGVAPMARQDA